MHRKQSKSRRCRLDPFWVAFGLGFGLAIVGFVGRAVGQ